MIKIFNLMLVAVLAIGISSCNKDDDEAGRIPDQPQTSVESGDIDWAVFAYLGEDVVNDLRNLINQPQTRAAGDITVSVEPTNTQITGEAQKAVVTVTKRTNDNWPNQLHVRIVEYSNMNVPYVDLIELKIPTTADASLDFEFDIPAFYSSVPNDSKVLIYQYSTNGAIWINHKVVLQTALVGEFESTLSTDYPNSRIPQQGGEIIIFRTLNLDNDVTFRVRSLDDNTEIADRVTMPGGALGQVTIEIKRNTNNASVIPFVIEYEYAGAAGIWIEFERGIQQTAQELIVSDVNIVGAYYISEVSKEHTLRLTVDQALTNEIKVRIIPHLHSAYDDSFTPLEATAYMINAGDASLNSWGFKIIFPAARGAAYGVGEEVGGWHKNFTKDMKKGYNGAGFWVVQYQNESGDWVDVGMFQQKAFYLGVKNDIASLRKAGGNWIVKTQGHWPSNCIISFVGYYINSDNQRVETNFVEAVPSSIGDSWDNAPAMLIPASTDTEPIIWKFEYHIQDVETPNGITWEKWITPNTREYSWEGKSNQLVQYHF